MRWSAIVAQAAIAASAMPVVGFITGKVVGEAMEKLPLLAAAGVVVYAVALAASYAHLRHYYARFDADGVRASPFIALAVEVATFYLSFASVVLESRWALWGSLIGAGVVFWGNLTSMAMGLMDRKASEELAKETYEGPERPERNAEVERPSLEDAGLGWNEALRDLERPKAEQGNEAERVPWANGVRTEHPGVRVVERRRYLNGTNTFLDPWAERNRPEAERNGPVAERHHLERAEQEGETEEPAAEQVAEERSTQPSGDGETSEEEKRILALLQQEPMGPRKLARELGLSPSTVSRRLKRLESRGLVRKENGLYRAEEPHA